MNYVNNTTLHRKIIWHFEEIKVVGKTLYPLHPVLIDPEDLWRGVLTWIILQPWALLFK